MATTIKSKFLAMFSKSSSSAEASTSLTSPLSDIILSSSLNSSLKTVTSAPTSRNFFALRVPTPPPPITATFFPENSM
jgi:hypothetical protein